MDEGLSTFLWEAQRRHHSKACSKKVCSHPESGGPSTFIWTPSALAGETEGHPVKSFNQPRWAAASQIMLVGDNERQMIYQLNASGFPNAGPEDWSAMCFRQTQICLHKQIRLQVCNSYVHPPYLPPLTHTQRRSHVNEQSSDFFHFSTCQKSLSPSRPTVNHTFCLSRCSGGKKQNAKTNRQMAILGKRAFQRQAFAVL